MGTINIQLVPAQEYMRFFADMCKKLCINQNDIDRAYNRIGAEWVDRIYIRTGEELRETAKNISVIYLTMTETISILQKRICALCIYNDTPEPTPILVESFTIEIKGGSMALNELVNTTPESLAQFERALNKYIEETSSTIRSIKSRHNSISQYWNDGQYVRFTEVLNDFSRKVDSQLVKLSALNALVERKRQQLIDSDRFRI